MNALKERMNRRVSERASERRGGLWDAEELNVSLSELQDLLEADAE